MQKINMKRLLTPIRVCFLVLILFFSPICGWLFRCGCTFLWSGSSSHCNIYDPVRPDCPWCVMPFGIANWFGLALQAIPVLLITLMTFGSLKLLGHFRGIHYWRDVLVGLLSMLVFAGLIGWIYARLMNYPDFRF